MKIIKSATAGSLESNDVMIGVYPKETPGVEIEIDSILKLQFGDRILAAVRQVAEELQVEAATVKVLDKGALDYVIRARAEAAFLRAKGGGEG